MSFNFKARYRLYIDDIRDPKTSGWVIVRSSKDAINMMSEKGCPALISFDHDLGGEDTAMKVVKWMIEFDMNACGDFIPQNFEFIVHSANPVGSKNITGLLGGYLKVR